MGDETVQNVTQRRSGRYFRRCYMLYRTFSQPCLAVKVPAGPWPTPHRPAVPPMRPHSVAARRKRSWVCWRKRFLPLATAARRCVSGMRPGQCADGASRFSSLGCAPIPVQPASCGHSVRGAPVASRFTASERAPEKCDRPPRTPWFRPVLDHLADFPERVLPLSDDLSVTPREIRRPVPTRRLVHLASRRPRR